jgi:hypothetical protein
MIRVRQRIENLEARLTDQSRLVPHTPAWLSYWANWLNQYVEGQRPSGRMPLEAVRALIRDDTDGTSVLQRR